MKIAIALVALACAAPAAPDDTRLEGFTKHMNDYVKLREQAIAKLGPIPGKASPEQIDKYRTALAENIRMARAGTQQGTVFDAPAVSYFSEVMKQNLRGASKEGAREVARQGNPGREQNATQPVIQVNAVYPQSAPKSTIPAPLLQVLPTLPTNIEYAFVGQTLILLDASVSNIIIDYMKGAAPGL